MCVSHDENGHHLELTDGVHFENLGLYELVRRQVGTIIVSDAGVDKNFKFGDLANPLKSQNRFRGIDKVRARRQCPEQSAPGLGFKWNYFFP